MKLLPTLRLSQLTVVGAVLALVCCATPLRAADTPLAKAELTNLADWTFSSGPLTLKNSASSRGLTFDFVTSKGANNNYVVGHSPVDWVLPDSGRIEIDASSRARFSAYCALALTSSDGRKFGRVLSGDSKLGQVFNPTGDIVSMPLSSFKTSEGQTPEGGVHISQVSISFGLESSVSNSVTFSRLELLPGSTPPVDNPIIRVNPAQNWTFQNGPLELRTGFDENGLGLNVTTKPEAANNYLVATLRHNWTLPESGRLDIKVKAAIKRAHYFACALIAADGSKYSAVLGGDPKRGFFFPTDFTIASVDLSNLKTADGKVAPSGTKIVAVALTLSFEPNLNTTIYVSSLDLVSQEVR
ncbi:MAG: hypothetical protein WC205_03680 [Opitutaceae bacterium]|jgi:hypothetical protein